MESNIPICTHVKTDGIRCGSPARRGRSFCYYHQRLYDGTAIRPDRIVPARDFPMLTSKSAVNTSITSLLRYVQAGRITPAEAHLMMNSIHFAADMLKVSKKKEKKRRQPRRKSSKL